jgi:hypothetical protein
MFKEVDPADVPEITTSLAGVNVYQTVWLAPQISGSAGSMVASVMSTESTKGIAVTAVALSKLSFEGGAALATDDDPTTATVGTARAASSRH